jgi:pimeloyl-ACP methyl ester carboxylesterase
MNPGRATLILVHGAWHGSWCWERLVPQLAERGLAVRTVDLPSVSHRADEHSRNPSSAGARPKSGSGTRSDRPAGLRDDAEAVRAVIESVEGPVVLCGHSYGGMVISLAASRSRVVRLIYLCAFMPEPRQSLVAINGGRSAPWIRMLDDEMTLPDLSLAGEVFYNDCDTQTREWAIARLAPQNNAAFVAPVARPAWRGTPSTYIVCARDGALPPDLQRTLFAPRAERTIELDTGHSPFLSQPAALAQALEASL